MAKLYFTATQGGADAFVQNTIATALNGQTKLAYRVTEICFEWVTYGPWLAIAANQEFEFCITRRTKAAIPLLTDVDVILKKSFAMTAGSTVGQFTQPEIVQSWRPPNPEAKSIKEGALVIVEDPLYVQIDSAATTVVQSIAGYIEYEVMTVTEVERLNLIAASLIA